MSRDVVRTPSLASPRVTHTHTTRLASVSLSSKSAILVSRFKGIVMFLFLKPNGDFLRRNCDISFAVLPSSCTVLSENFLVVTNY